MDKYHGSTSEAVQRINTQDSCPVKLPSLEPTESDTQEISAQQRKGEYYYFLSKFLPEVVNSVSDLRQNYPLGLVKYEEGDGQPRVVSSIDDKFLGRIEAAKRDNDFLKASYWVHDSIARGIDIATEVWANRLDWQRPDLKRLVDLVDPHRQQLYGAKAAQKRISSAMIQTLHISGSFERFIYDFFKEQHGKAPSAEQMQTLHSGTLKTASHLTDLHIERTREIRPLVGAETEEDGIVHRYMDNQYFYLTADRLELKEDALPRAMAERPIDASDGRIGCPGKVYIPEVWSWVEEVSAKYSYPLLEE